MLTNCKTPRFSMPDWSSSVEFGITGYDDPGQLPHEGSQDTDLVMCQFPLFVVLCDHNPPTLQTDVQTDRRTDRRHARSIDHLPHNVCLSIRPSFCPSVTLSVSETLNQRYIVTLTTLCRPSYIRLQRLRWPRRCCPC